MSNDEVTSQKFSRLPRVIFDRIVTPSDFKFVRISALTVRYYLVDDVFVVHFRSRAWLVKPIHQRVPGRVVIGRPRGKRNMITIDPFLDTINVDDKGGGVGVDHQEGADGLSLQLFGLQVVGCVRVVSDLDLAVLPRNVCIIMTLVTLLCIA